MSSQQLKLTITDPNILVFLLGEVLKSCTQISHKKRMTICSCKSPLSSPSEVIYQWKKGRNAPVLPSSWTVAICYGEEGEEERHPPPQDPAAMQSRALLLLRWHGHPAALQILHNIRLRRFLLLGSIRLSFKFLSLTFSPTRSFKE